MAPKRLKVSELLLLVFSFPPEPIPFFFRFTMRFFNYAQYLIKYFARKIIRWRCKGNVWVFNFFKFFFLTQNPFAQSNQKLGLTQLYYLGIIWSTMSPFCSFSCRLPCLAVSPEQTNGIPGTIFTVINSIIGGGVVAIPFQFTHSGLALGMILVGVMGVLIAASVRVLVSTSIAVFGKSTSTLTFS